MGFLEELKDCVECPISHDFCEYAACAICSRCEGARANLERLRRATERRVSEMRANLRAVAR